MSYLYKFAILGGTFDHLHDGHEKFITTAFNQAENITIGIVETLLNRDKSFKNSIENFSTRKNNLISLLSKLKIASRANIIPINDIFGTSLTDNSLEAIFVTESTKDNAELINLERQKHSKLPLVIVVIPYVIGDDGNIISSHRIRAGEINRRGFSYLKFFLQKETYLLPVDMRESLQQPIGIVVSTAEAVRKLVPPSSYIISVGDIVSIDLKNQGYPATISIIDSKSRRVDIPRETIDEYFPVVNKQFTNPAGSIKSEIADSLLSCIANYKKTQESQVIAVNGEEDLLALPSILLSPLGSYVIYGQYNIGIIVVEVTEHTKNLAKHYLEEFQ